MKNRKGEAGGLLYFEWIYPIKDYKNSSEKRELFFDAGVPSFISVIVLIIGIYIDKIEIMSAGLANMLFSLTSVLIGFSIMLVTMLMTSGGKGIDELKSRIIPGKKLYGENISLFQKLHIQFIYSLIIEVVLLLMILFFFIVFAYGIQIKFFSFFFLSPINSIAYRNRKHQQPVLKDLPGLMFITEFLKVFY